MKLLLFKQRWGHEGTFADAAKQVLDAGFHGIEGPLPTDRAERAEFISVLRDNDLKYIAEISTTGYATPDPGSTVDDHLEAFKRILDSSLEAEPLFFSSMAGNDLWVFRDSVRFLTEAYEIVQDRGVRLGFETHRSRTLFHPVITRELLKEVPPIEMTLDFSHWCVVTERLVLDQLPDVLDLCAERALHIQPRVGYDQGPQVPDPRAPEYAYAVEAHLRWWKHVWAGQRARGFDTITMTPEFGPDGYLHLEPYTQKPVANLWELNSWMGQYLKKEFQNWAQQPSA